MVTTPDDDTLATPVLSDCHCADDERSSTKPLLSVACARNWLVWPRWKKLATPVTATELTRGGDGTAALVGPVGTSLSPHAADRAASTTAAVRARTLIL